MSEMRIEPGSIRIQVDVAFFRIHRCHCPAWPKISGRQWRFFKRHFFNYDAKQCAKIFRERPLIRRKQRSTNCVLISLRCRYDESLGDTVVATVDDTALPLMSIEIDDAISAYFASGGGKIFYLRVIGRAKTTKK